MQQLNSAQVFHLSTWQPAVALSELGRRNTSAGQEPAAAGASAALQQPRVSNAVAPHRETSAALGLEPCERCITCQAHALRARSA